MIRAECVRPLFSGSPMTHRLDVACSRELAARWCALAERRLDHLTELFDSGRWRRYYTEQAFLDDLRHAKAAVQTWKGLSRAEPEPVSIVPRQSPAATLAVPPAPVRRAEPEPGSIVASQRPAAKLAAPPAPVRLAEPEPITLHHIQQRPVETPRIETARIETQRMETPRVATPIVEHRPIALPRSLETVLAESEIVVEPEIELSADDPEPDFVIEPDDVEADVAPDLTMAPARIDMSALEQALSIGMDESDAEYDEPVVDLDAIERRYPALAVAY
ncbi:TIGR03809 family protein [Bradyrhizobium sp. ORS 285]|uniref:TIGR03809 family protein n=1 Tax=Bradyrhizobium sp. ORS 285 TaxID=115808 RepID=UPI001FCB33B7|nr:TIGR03809 family protein [Bradyrhizobium sp. ORS 285]